MISRAHRFHGHNSLNYVYKQGKTVRAADIALRFVINDKRTDYRCAVVVSKKVSKSAVVRNRIRRRVYESVRVYCLQESLGPLDMVFSIYNSSLETLPANELQTRVFQLLDQAVEKH